jgi:hypothetical protein
MPNPVPARYQDAGGVQHEVVVRKARASAWQVLDIGARKATVIETLIGVDEGQAEAEAIAREYARHQQAAHETAAAARRG